MTRGPGLQTEKLVDSLLMNMIISDFECICPRYCNTFLPPTIAGKHNLITVDNYVATNPYANARGSSTVGIVVLNYDIARTTT